MKKTNKQLRIILADDHKIFREGFRSTFKKQSEIILVAEAENGQELVHLTGIHQPDVVLTDIQMPVMDGIEAAHIIKSRYPQVGIIALSMFSNNSLVIDMLDAGAKGYLLKNAHKDEIIDAIKTVARHNAYYCSSTTVKMAQIIAQRLINPDNHSGRIFFSDKEKEIMVLICRELSNREIGDRLHLSTRTIEGYRERILEKINARNTAGIVVYSISRNIFTPD